jgi:uncharacterized protein YcbK (DUF882 family)
LRHAFTIAAALRARLSRSWRAGLPTCLALAVGATALLAPSATQNAIANGDTRTLSLYHSHTGESATITFRVNGTYDSAALEKLNWLLRDWRRDEPIRMDPRVFDVVWEVQRMSGSQAPIKIMSAYRSPSTNAMLRRRSRAVAEHSQHMLGKAMDVHFDDVSVSRAREMGLRLQRGGVGYYPSANSPFVHLDVGSVRHWPRMTYDQLARVFPDGKTVHIPSNGQPLPGYDQALAEIEAHGGSAYASAYVQSQKSKGLFAFLFGGGEEEGEEEVAVVAPRGRGGKAGRGRQPPPSVGVEVASASGDDAGSRSFFSGFTPRQEPAAQAPTIQTAMRPTRRGATMPAREQRTEVAALDPRAGDALEESRAAEQAKLADEAKAAADAKAAAAEAKAAAKTAAARQLAEAKAAEAKTVAEAKAQALAEAKAAADAKADEQRARMEMRLAEAPLPPRRPTTASLAELSFANVPTPPSRPLDLAGLRGEAKPGPKKVSALEASSLPSLITEGAGQAARPASVALSYAPEPQTRSVAAPKPPAVARPDLPRAPAPTFVAARIDRATFRALTADAPAERVTTQAALAPALAPLRAGRRAEPKTDMLRPGVDVVSNFGDAPSALPVGRFEGKAIEPIPRPSSFGGLRAASEGE